MKVAVRINEAGQQRKPPAIHDPRIAIFERPEQIIASNFGDSPIFNRDEFGARTRGVHRDGIRVIEDEIVHTRMAECYFLNSRENQPCSSFWEESWNPALNASAARLAAPRPSWIFTPYPVLISVFGSFT